MWRRCPMPAPRRCCPGSMPTLRRPGRTMPEAASDTAPRVSSRPFATTLIAIQRTAGRTATDATERKRVFSWLGLAPALSNAIGPVLAGTLIDLGGFRVAFAALMLLPLASLWSARRVPIEVPAPATTAQRPRSSWDLLRAPGMRRLLL